MATLRNKKKLEAVARDNQEGYSRNRQSRNSAVPRMNEEYITQISGEIEGRVTKKLSQEFTRTESQILGVLFKLDEFLLKPQVQSGIVPGTSRNMDVENQEPSGDRSLNDARPGIPLSSRPLSSWIQTLRRHPTSAFGICSAIIR